MMTLVKSVRHWLEAGLAFFYPEVCQLCGQARAGISEGFVCESCRKGVRHIERPFCERCGLPFQGALTQQFECANCRQQELHFTSARSAVVARDVVLEVIHRYKYRRALWFEPFLAELLVTKARSELATGKWDFIVPVPLHRTKEREREFNQAARLSRHLSRATGLPIQNRLIRRILPTETQTRLTREERQANVRRAFSLVRGARAEGARIVLVDDVFTTGATTNACAEVLRRAGAAEVCVWTVARGV